MPPKRKSASEREASEREASAKKAEVDKEDQSSTQYQLAKRWYSMGELEKMDRKEFNNITIDKNFITCNTNVPNTYRDSYHYTSFPFRTYVKVFIKKI